MLHRWECLIKSWFSLTFVGGKTMCLQFMSVDEELTCHIHTNQSSHRLVNFRIHLEIKTLILHRHYGESVFTTQQLSCFATHSVQTGPNDFNHGGNPAYHLLEKDSFPFECLSQTHFGLSFITTWCHLQLDYLESLLSFSASCKQKPPEIMPIHCFQEFLLGTLETALFNPLDTNRCLG